MNIEITEITSEINGCMYLINYRINKRNRSMRILKSEILDYLPRVGEYYEEGLRIEDVNNVFINSLKIKDYRYIIKFIKYYHDV